MQTELRHMFSVVGFRVDTFSQIFVQGDGFLVTIAADYMRRTPESHRWRRQPALYRTVQVCSPHVDTQATHTGNGSCEA
jgi:hypothetical protein